MVRSWILTALCALGLAAGCGNPLDGGNSGPRRPLHFRVHVVNQEVASAETASLCWWSGSAYVGSKDLLVPPGGSVTFDLGTVKPDGIQLVMGTARLFNGIIQGPGGYVLQTPNYDDTWDPSIGYPWGQYWKGP